MGHTALCCAGENQRRVLSLRLGHQMLCLLLTLLRASCTSFHDQISLLAGPAGEVMSAPHHSPLSFAVFAFPVFFSLPLGVFPTLCTTFFFLFLFFKSLGGYVCVSLWAFL